MTLPITAAQVTREARTYVGRSESPANSNRTPFGVAFGLNGEPWCAIWVWYVFRRLGVDLRTLLGSHIAWTVAFEQEARRAGWAHIPYAAARAGDIVFMGGRGFLSIGICHMGVCVGREGGQIVNVEGNTHAEGHTGSEDNGGTVAYRRRAESLVLSIVRPPYALTTPVGHSVAAFTLTRVLRLRRFRYMRGRDVKAVQHIVGARVDGVYGPQTVRRVAIWQDRHNLTPDGQFGPRSAHAAGWRFR